MKKTKKTAWIVLTIYFITAAITCAADILVQYWQNYAAAPYVEADPSVLLTADDVLFQTPEDEVTPERAPYLLGWLRDEEVGMMWYPNTITGVKAKDARTDEEAAVIENAGYHIFSTEENTAFDSLLRKLTFRPLRGMKNMLTHRKLNAENFIASFRLRSFWAQDPNGESYSPWTLFEDKIIRGEIFTVGDGTYLAGCFNVGGTYNEDTDRYEENPAVHSFTGNLKANPEQYSLFEIEPSDALTALLAQRESLSGENERISRYAPFYPQHSAKIALLIETALFLLALGLLLTREKKKAVRLLSLLAAFSVTVGGTLAVVLHGDYMALFRPSVYTNAEDNLFSFDALFSDLSQEKLDNYETKIVIASHRLQFVQGGTTWAPEEFTMQTQEIYARPDWRSSHFSKADMEEFADLLRRLKYIPVKGIKSVLTAARMTEKNAFGYFVRGDLNELSEGYYEDDPCFPCVVWRGQFFTTGGHTYLLASFRMDEDLGASLSAKYRQDGGVNLSFAVFEIAPGDALDRLLEKQDDFRGDPPKAWGNAYYTWFPSGWVIGETVLFALLALYILIDHKKNRSTGG